MFNQSAFITTCTYFCVTWSVHLILTHVSTFQNTEIYCFIIISGRGNGFVNLWIILNLTSTYRIIIFYYCVTWANMCIDNLLVGKSQFSVIGFNELSIIIIVYFRTDISPVQMYLTVFLQQYFSFFHLLFIFKVNWTANMFFF